MIGRGALFRRTALIAAAAGPIFLLMVVGFMVGEAWPAICGDDAVPMADFFWRAAWKPWSDPPRLGIVHAWISTLAVSAMAVFFAGTLGLGVALFLSELAPRPIAVVLRPCLELLAGIPSVVYGFFGAVTLVKGFEMWFSLPTGECLGVAGLILAVMILPFVAGTAADVLDATPRELREAAMAQGVSRTHMIRRVLIPAAAPGLFSALGLGLARAVGETLAVLMLAGNSTRIPLSPLARGQPITALLATELGEAEVGSVKYHALFLAGALLLVVVAVRNALFGRWRRRIAHG